MIIYIDENLSTQLAEGLNKLQQPLNKKNGTDFSILSIKKEFGEGAKDEDWIPAAGNQGAIAITRDFKIQTTRHQFALCKEHNLGLFFLKDTSSHFGYWQMVQSIVNHWEEILSTIQKNSPPYAFRFSSRTKLENISS